MSVIDVFLYVNLGLAIPPMIGIQKDNLNLIKLRWGKVKEMVRSEHIGFYF